MRRREFIAGVGGAAAWPLATLAQQAAMPVIGFLNPGTPEGQARIVAAFLHGLGETDFIEGRSVIIEYRWGQNQPERLPELAAELARKPVAVIATPGSTAAALAAKAATATIPIVFGIAADPMQAGLVASLNRPGGNITGFTEMSTEVGSKRFGLLHELLPRAVRFGVLVNPNALLTTEITIREARAAAAANGGQIEVLAASTDREIDAAFANLPQTRVDALLVAPDPTFYGFRTQLAMLAARHSIPAIYWDRALAEAGGLMSYGSSVTEMFRQVGIYTGRILKGEKAADLPILQPTKFELVINLNTAKALNLEIPPGVLAIADAVIE